MARSRITEVQSARKATKCGKCGMAIMPGDSYLHWSFRYGGKHVRCGAAACRPGAWELESNGKLQSMMRAENALSLAEYAETAEEMIGHLEEATSEVESVKEEMEAAVDGWQSAGLDQSERAQNWSDAVYELDSWLDTMESIKSDLHGVDESDSAGRAYSEYEPEECDDHEGCSAWSESLEEARGAIEPVPEFDL